MITFAAFTPHSPLLLDSIGKKNIKYLSKTREALNDLSVSLRQTKPDVLFVISSHRVVHENVFSVNLHDAYEVEFKEFGDLATSREFFPDLELITDIQRSAHTLEIPFVLDSYVSLDYGSGVPLFLLCEKIQPQIVPISYSGNDRKQHLAFGRLLKDVAIASQKRIGVIASGDLSHSLTSDAPAGFHEEGKEFDQTVLRSIEQFSSSTLLSLDEDVVARAVECALRPLLMLYGMLEHMSVRPEARSYEAPFGVGYLVAEFHV
jgi:aromatic ring-opening dioxygenase LigB subunit